MKTLILSFIVLTISISLNAQWNPNSASTDFITTTHGNSTNDFGLNLQPSGGNYEFLIHNNLNGGNQQTLYFGHANSTKNIFGISTSPDSGSTWTARFVVNQNGNVGIGTQDPDSKLTVNGKIHCNEVLVDTNFPAPDYVFEKYYQGTSALKADYTMPTLEEVEAFTKANHHLPEIPSAQEIKDNGLKLKEMSNLLLQKIEELTLYTIEQEKRIKALESKLTKE